MVLGLSSLNPLVQPWDQGPLAFPVLSITVTPNILVILLPPLYPCLISENWFKLFGKRNLLKISKIFYSAMSLFSAFMKVGNTGARKPSAL